MKRINIPFFTSLVALIVSMAIFLPGTCFSKRTNFDVIRFADLSWDSVQVHNRIAGFIIKHGYGREIEYLPGETVPMITGICKGELDIHMESWTENIQEIYDKGINSGQMLDLGSNYPDSWQGWLVPTYMIKGDPERGIKATAPDLKSVKDLPKYWELFRDPEVPKKGRFFNSIPGWLCTKINSQKLEGYGLDEYYNDFITGSDAALAGSLASAYKKGKPWFGFYWAPTWVLGKYDMTPLEEPGFDPEVWETTKACTFKPTQVNILVNSKLPERAPEIVEFLKKYETTTAMTNKFLAYMQDTKGSTDDAAIWFLKKYEGTWSEWVPEDIKAKVSLALSKL